MKSLPQNAYEKCITVHVVGNKMRKTGNKFPVLREKE